MVNEKELKNGDTISLVDRLKIPIQYRSDIKEFSFVLRKVFEDPMPEILVSTKTDPIDVIVIDSSDDEADKDEKPADGLNKFVDDYEVGEPSSKYTADSTSIVAVHTPERTDPVSKVCFKFIHNNRTTHIVHKNACLILTFGKFKFIFHTKFCCCFRFLLNWTIK